MDFKRTLVGIATTAVGFAFGYWAYNKFLKMKPATTTIPAADAPSKAASPLQGV